MHPLRDACCRLFLDVKIEKLIEKRHLEWIYLLMFYRLLFIVMCYDMKLVDSLHLFMQNELKGFVRNDVNIFRRY